MESRPRYLIVAAVAIMAYLPVPIGPALGQEAKPVIIRASAPRARSGRVPVSVTVSKSRVRVGEWVMVNLTPPAGVERPLFRVNFGDGREELTRNRQIDHKYGRVGHYDILAWVESESPRPRPVPRVFLSVAPNTTPVGKAVAFSAQLAGDYPGLKYRFVFGDLNQTAWQDQPQTTHSYTLADTFNAYVEIGAEENGAFKVVGRSGREPVQVSARTPIRVTPSPTPLETPRPGSSPAPSPRGSPAPSPRNSPAPSPRSSPAPSPRSSPAPSPGSSPTSSPDGSPTPATGSSPTSSPDSPSSSPVPPRSITDSTPSPNDRNPIVSDWWKYLLVVLLISFVAYRAFKMLFAARPTFRAVPDTGGSDVDEGKNPLAINAQILFSPDIADGLYRVSTTEANLVRSIREGE